MKALQQLLDTLIRTEGGYVDHPNDRGGPTKYGITQAVARAYGYEGDMRDLPEHVARTIYAQRYWFEPRFDQVAAISPRIAEELLDTGVNMGPEIATQFLQRALTGLNRQGKDYPDLKVDGRIGPMTLDALRRLLAFRGADGVTVLMRLLDAQQAVRYITIAEARPTQEDFLFGWVLHRVGTL